MSAEFPALPALPVLNALVRVRLGDDGGSSYASRVEDTDGAELLLAAPSYAGDLREPVPGDGITLLWTGVRGMYSARVQFAGIERSGGVRCWHVRVTGAVRVEQRRRFARVPIGAPVQVEVEGRPDSVVGRVLDLGEGGVRARFEPAADLRPGDRVSLRLGLDARLVVIGGSVLRVLARTADGQEVVLVLDEHRLHSDAIRRFVLQQQLLARRAAR